MAALQCDICGGKLMGRPGGIFECDSCGMQYDTAWAKEKIQEIRGTVKVEGTVQVAGTVKVDGPVKVEGGISVQSLCERGFFELEKGTAAAAKEAFERALDIDLNWGDIYMGLMMANFIQRPNGRVVSLYNQEEFREKLLHHELDEHVYFQKFLSVPGSPKHKELVEAYQQKLVEEARLKEENFHRGNRNIAYYRELRKKYSPVRGRITRHGEYLLDHTGRLISKDYTSGTDFQAEQPWEDLIWISQPFGSGRMLLGVYADGTVIAEDTTQRIEAFEPDDHVMQAVGFYQYDSQGFAGMREDGTLVTSSLGKPGEVQSVLREASRKWKGKEIEAVCEIAGKIGYNNLKLHIVVPSDPERGHIAWEEQEPEKIAAQLHINGTVTISHCDYHTIRCETELWGDLIQVVPGKKAVAGLRADGTVVYAAASDPFGQYEERIRNEVSWWKDIVFIRMVNDEVIGVKRDGTLVSTSDYYCESMIDKWNIRLFENIDTLADDILKHRTKAYADWQEKKRVQQLEEEEPEEEDDPYAEQRMVLEEKLQVIHAQLDGLKGILFIKRRRELEEQMGKILLELDELKELK